MSQKDFYGYSPLDVAIENGHAEIVEWLLLKRSDCKIPSTNELNPLDFALASGYSIISKLLSDNGFKCTLKYKFYSTIKFQNEKLPKKEFGEDVEYQFHALNLVKYGDNEIMDLKSATQHVLKCVKLCDLKSLMCYEIPFEKYRDEFGATIWHIAAAYARNDIILWLYITTTSEKSRSEYEEEQDFDGIESVDKFGYTCLQYAALNGHKSTIELITALLTATSQKHKIERINLYKPHSNPIINHYKYFMAHKKQFIINNTIEELKLCIKNIDVNNRIGEHLVRFHKCLIETSIRYQQFKRTKKINYKKNDSHPHPYPTISLLHILC